MNLSTANMNRILKRKIATLLMLTASVAAFATLGDDGGRRGRKDNTSSLLPYSAKNFSLRSNYNYSSNNWLSQPEKKDFIMLSPVITYQKGNTAYVLPLKKMPLLGKITFTPAPQKF
jgi:hypothetical protein